jgi:hypothetical protein
MVKKKKKKKKGEAEAAEQEEEEEEGSQAAMNLQQQQQQQPSPDAIFSLAASCLFPGWIMEEALWQVICFLQIVELQFVLGTLVAESWRLCVGCVGFGYMHTHLCS